MRLPSSPPIAEAAGREVILVGSAPGGRLPTHGFGKLLVCVNGAQLGHGLANPDVLVLNTAVTANYHASWLLQPHLHKLRADHLVIVEGTPFYEAWPMLADVRRRRMSIVSRIDLGIMLPNLVPWICSDTTGDHIPSTGALTLLWLLAAGAQSVETVGFSLTGGHSYLPGVPTPRHHEAQDRAVFEMLRGDPRVIGLSA